MERPRLFVDMDGTLAKFRAAELEELYRPGYFADLDPQQSVVDAIRLVCQSHPDIEVYILSAVLADSATAEAEKDLWLDQYLPELEEDHRIFLPCGKEKSAYVPNGVGRNDFLLDDYTANLTSWSQHGGKGIKLLNGINHTRGSWLEDQLRFDRDPAQLALSLIRILEHATFVRDAKPMQHLEKYSAAMERAGYEPVDATDAGSDLLLWRDQNGKIISLDGIEGVKGFLSRVGRRINDGYEIIQSIEVAGKTFVLGQSIESPEQFVTWRQFNQGTGADYEWGHYSSEKLTAQKDLLTRGLAAVEDETQAVQAAATRITANSDHIQVDGHEGTWYVIDTARINEADFFLLEHEKYGDQAASVIVDAEGKLVLNEVWDGFESFVEYLQETMTTAEKIAYIQTMGKKDSLTDCETQLYDALIDWQAACAIDAHEAEFSADGFRAFPGSFDFEPEL